MCPFDRGKCGLDVTCSNFHFDMKSLNVFAVYCGPLSDSSISGIPCVENHFFSCLITSREVADFSFLKSKNPEYLSAMSK